MSSVDSEIERIRARLEAKHGQLSNLQVWLSLWGTLFVVLAQVRCIHFAWSFAAANAAGSSVEPLDDRAVTELLLARPVIQEAVIGHAKHVGHRARTLRACAFLCCVLRCRLWFKCFASRHEHHREHGALSREGLDTSWSRSGLPMCASFVSVSCLSESVDEACR